MGTGFSGQWCVEVSHCKTYSSPGFNQGWLVTGGGYSPRQGGGRTGILEAGLDGGGGPTPQKKNFDIPDKPRLVTSYCRKRQSEGLVGCEDETENCFNDPFNGFGDA